MYITQSALFFDLVIFISTCTDVLFDLRPGELKEKKGSFERYTWWWWWSSSFFRIWYIWFGVARKYLVRDGRWHDVPPPFFRPSPLPPIRLNNFHVVSINTMCFEYRYMYKTRLDALLLQVYMMSFFFCCCRWLKFPKSKFCEPIKRRFPTGKFELCLMPFKVNQWLVFQFALKSTCLAGHWHRLLNR